MSDKTVLVTLELPKGILEFLKEKVEDVKDYLEEAIIQGVGADIDDLETFGFKDIDEAEEAINRFGLNKALKKDGCRAPLLGLAHGQLNLPLFIWS